MTDDGDSLKAAFDTGTLITHILIHYWGGCVNLWQKVLQISKIMEQFALVYQIWRTLLER